MRCIGGPRPSLDPPRVQSVVESLELLVHLILCGLEGGLRIDLTADSLVDILDEGILHRAGRVEDVGVGLGILGSLRGFLVGSLEDGVVGDLRRVVDELVESLSGSREDDGASIVRPGVLVLSVSDPLGELNCAPKLGRF